MAPVTSVMSVGLTARAEMLAAPGTLRDQLTASLREVVAATRAGRAILFLRDPDGYRVEAACHLAP